MHRAFVVRLMATYFSGPRNGPPARQNWPRMRGKVRNHAWRLDENRGCGRARGVYYHGDKREFLNEAEARNGDIGTCDGAVGSRIHADGSRAQRRETYATTLRHLEAHGTG